MHTGTSASKLNTQTYNGRHFHENDEGNCCELSIWNHTNVCSDCYYAFKVSLI